MSKWLVIEHFRGSPGFGQDESGSDPSAHVHSMHDTEARALAVMLEVRKKDRDTCSGTWYTIDRDRRVARTPLASEESQKPVLSESEAWAMFKKLGHVQGRVEVDLNDLIACDLEEFLDLISIRLIGDDLLMDVSYEVCGCVGGTIFIQVEGQLPDEEERP